MEKNTWKINQSIQIIYQACTSLYFEWVYYVTCFMFAAGVLCWLINGRYYPINPREREIFLGDTKIADKFWYGSAKISNVDDCSHDPLQLLSLFAPRVWECINISKCTITMSRSRGKFRVLKTFFTTLETGDLSRQTCKRCLPMFGWKCY